MATKKSASASTVKKFFPRIDKTVPYEVKRHLQLIYEKLNNHAEAFGVVATKIGTTTNGKVAGGAGGSGGGTVVIVPPSPPALPNAILNNILLGSGNAGAGLPYAELALGTNLSMAGTTLNAASSTTIVGVPLGVTFDGGSSVPTPPIMRLIEIPFNCTITSWTVTSDVAGSCSVDIWFLAGSAPPAAPPIPTVANKISAAAPIALAAAQSAGGGAAAITTWTTALTQWGVLAFNLTSVTTCKWISVQIQVTRT